MDAYEHVNNTVYFRFMEQARVEWLERVGYRCNARQEAPVIINASCSFLVPLAYPGVVEVRMFAGHAGRSSVPTYYELRSRTSRRSPTRRHWICSVPGRSCKGRAARTACHACTAARIFHARGLSRAQSSIGGLYAHSSGYQRPANR